MQAMLINIGKSVKIEQREEPWAKRN